ncbi:hypothetical protein [Acrocarpospora sp. B8E8]|uniref:hypothetical protein n=1 Tax=Acrocarpospora sp. B8E8 TaxID=3153572 RepID=UPI00325CF634
MFTDADVVESDAVGQFGLSQDLPDAFFDRVVGAVRAYGLEVAEGGDADPVALGQPSGVAELAYSVYVH